jgi:hypothetical protein
MMMGYIALMIKPYYNPPDVWLETIEELGRFLGNQYIFRGLKVVFVFIFLIIYVFSRCFLVVEAFISLRRLPTTAYSTPSWTQYLAHL